MNFASKRTRKRLIKKFAKESGISEADVIVQWEEDKFGGELTLFDRNSSNHVHYNNMIRNDILEYDKQKHLSKK